MIKLTQGDILRADVEAIVNAVNCVGVMGRGIALQFKKPGGEFCRLRSRLQKRASATGQNVYLQHRPVGQP